MPVALALARCESEHLAIWGVMMTRFFTWLIPALLITACGNPPEPPPIEKSVAPADLVLTGGVIASVDATTGLAEAIAVSKHVIVAIGSSAEIDAYVGPETKVVELNGRFAMPGFIEGHGHFTGYGMAQQVLDLSVVSNWDEVVSKVAVAADKSQPGEWIIGFGWHQDKWDELPADAVDGVPINETLSRISADNPVLLQHASGHASIANEAALAEGGIVDDTPDPAGGVIVRAADGTATGLLRETAQISVEGAHRKSEESMSPAERESRDRERVYLAGQAALQFGVTSFHDAGISFEEIDFLRLLEREGALPIRLYVMVRYEDNASMAKLLPHYYMPAEENDFLTVRSIKRQVDGALGVHGAWLLEPYDDMPDTSGLVLETIEDIERTAVIALENGFQLNTHAIGDRANREILDLYERAFEKAEVKGVDQRWRIEHAQHLDPADIGRFSELGVVASMQGVHCSSDGPWIPARLGDERSEATSYRWRDLIDSGAIVTNGTDVPVEAIDPIASYYSSVSRMMRDGTRFHPEQAMTREEALASYTINNAIAAFEEEEKGTLVPGKLADIVVLSQNLLTVEEAKIPATVVEMTIVGGEIVYQREMN